jgi:hypothetical protein
MTADRSATVDLLSLTSLEDGVSPLRYTRAERT